MFIDIILKANTKLFHQTRITYDSIDYANSHIQCTSLQDDAMIAPWTLHVQKQFYTPQEREQKIMNLGVYRQHWPFPSREMRETFDPECAIILWNVNSLLYGSRFHSTLKCKQILR